MVQLSHPYMTTGKTIALTRETFVYKVMFLLFNMLFRLVIAFLPRSKIPLPGIFPNPGTEPTSPESPALADGFFTTIATWELDHKEG